MPEKVGRPPKPSDSGSTEMNLDLLKPPPSPWAELASLGSLYLLGDIDRLGIPMAKAFLVSHPIIVVQHKKTRIVVGQYRSWELALSLRRRTNAEGMMIPVTLHRGDEALTQEMAARNLLLEGLLYSLSPECAALQLAHAWKSLPDSIKRDLLPGVDTQAAFSALMAYSSRTGFETRRLNKLRRNEAADAATGRSDLAEQDDTKELPDDGITT